MLSLQLLYVLGDRSFIPPSVPPALFVSVLFVVYSDSWLVPVECVMSVPLPPAPPLSLQHKLRLVPLQY